MEKFEALEVLKRDIEKIKHSIADAAGTVTDNENLKEYLIEIGYWNEDYNDDVNIAELVLDILIGAKAL